MVHTRGVRQLTDNGVETEHVTTGATSSNFDAQLALALKRELAGFPMTSIGNFDASEC